MSQFTPAADGKTTIPRGGSLRAAFRLIAPFWRSSKKWIAVALLGVTLLNIAFNTATSVWYNHWTGDFMRAITRYEASKIPPLLVQFLYLLVAVIIIGVVHTFASQALLIIWRRWLSEHFLSKWLLSNTFYRLEQEHLLDNPDQRISEDVRKFIDSTSTLVLGLVATLATLVSFSVILWRLSGVLHLTVLGRSLAVPGYFLYVAVIYALLTSLLVQLVGRRLMGLTFAQERLEADFRFQMAGVRENAEQIAFYKGAAAERVRGEDALKNVIDNLWRITFFNMRFDPLTNILGFVAFMVPLVAALPQYLNHTIDFGEMTRLGGAFATVNGGLSWFINNYAPLQQYRTTILRLDQLDAVTEATPDGQGVRNRVGDSAGLEVHDLTLVTPQGRTLTSGLNLTIGPGERWLVRGSSGVGKTSLLRALAGIWPYGSGEIVAPKAARLMFLSQKGYVPAGSLKAALCYPSGPEAFGDDECRQVLRDCRLETYAEALQDSARWAQRLSPGEQQRLAIARAMLHEPDYLLMDESTNAVDRETEAHLFDLITDRLSGATLVTVSHYPALDRYHSHTLRLLAGGAFEIINPEAAGERANP
jgi:putative ATP-binding cassette transporter